MGRTLDALRKGAGEKVKQHLPHSTVGTHAREDVEPVDPDMPYIEVGPSRQVEGSPEVLQPAAAAHAPAPHTPARPPVESHGGPWFSAHPPRGIPEAEYAPGVVINRQSNPSLAAQYEKVLESVLGTLVGMGPRVLVFTTPLQGVPASSVVINLGTTAARCTSRRVLVLDASNRQPGLNELLHLPTSPGLCDILEGRVALEQAMRRTPEANLLVLTGGSAEVNAPSLRREPLRHLLSELRLRFDLILVDGPRWDNDLEAALLAALSDATFLILPEQEVHSAVTERLYQRIPEQGVQLAGSIVLQG
jgi:Mrp family chromosome partitioning ATPase